MLTPPASVRYSFFGLVRARLGYTGVHNEFADED